MYARKQRLQLCVLCGLRSQVSNISQLEILLAPKDVSHGWEGGGEGGGRVGGVPGYWGYYLSDHVRQSARTTGARWPISRPHNSKVAPCKNTYALESGQIF